METRDYSRAVTGTDGDSSVNESRLSDHILTTRKSLHGHDAGCLSDLIADTGVTA